MLSSRGDICITCPHHTHRHKAQGTLQKRRRKEFEPEDWRDAVKVPLDRM